MERLPQFPTPLLVVAVSLMLAMPWGCSGEQDGPQRFPLKGKASVDGVPILEGMIALSPDDKKGNAGPGSTIMIDLGEYSIDQAHGIVGGPYRAQFSIYRVGEVTDEAARVDDDDDDGPVAGVAFKPYHKSIEVDLPAEGGTYDFEL